jgi:hypothetical protein
VASNNGNNGILTSYGGSIDAQNATASNNVGIGGIVTNFGGSIFAQGATALGNTTNNVVANVAGNITFTGGSGAGLLSPAANTTGNGNARITV